ncbi:MAG TPA: ABC-type transport auxiliary lipoprotein family protein [Candidatus Binatia bacterium]|nr:ABC-type transport auxiliary lipoprotein family protein [Candidatus Binatia bacterium]
MKPFKMIPSAAALLIVLSSGCVSLERGYPDKRFYVLEVRTPPATSGPERDEILQVSPLRISPRYQDRSFVYRISDNGFESDFYNQFIAPPAGLISEEIRKGLISARIFKYVISASNSQAPSYVLEGTVNGIYGDFKNSNAPAAVIDLEFFLTSDLPAKPGILMQKRYVQSVPVSGRSPEALVKSWDLALEQILAALTADLSAVK